MRKEIQAYIADTAGQITAGWDPAAIWGQDQDESMPINTETFGFALQKYPFKKGCEANKSHDGINHCIINDTKGHHVCLSVYGKLFDGYDHASTSHFSGMVLDDAVEIYDYSEGDFFRFEKV